MKKNYFKNIFTTYQDYPLALIFIMNGQNLMLMNISINCKPLLHVPIQVFHNTVYLKK